MTLQAPGLDSGLNIIEAVAENREISFTQLKNKLSLSPASLNRYLKILLERGYIEKNENQQYVPGIRMKALYKAEAPENLFTEIAAPVLQKISATLGHTSLWISFYGGKMVCTDKFVVPEGVVMQEVGSARTDYPIHPWGYLFLAGMPAEKRQFYIQNAAVFPGYSKYIPDPNTLDHFIHEASQNGFSDDTGALFPNLRRIAVPVYLNGRLAAALGVGVPGTSIPPGHLREITETLKEKSRQISNLMPPDSY